MQSVAVFRVWRGMLDDVALVAFGCVVAVGFVLYFFLDFKERGMGSFLHPAVTVARWRWQFGWSEGAGRLFSPPMVGVEMRHRGLRGDGEYGASVGGAA
jgi:hypothetical protein